MKILSLNVWGGCLFDPLLQFVQDSAASTDVFCFQEIFRNAGDPYFPTFGHASVRDLFERFARILPDFESAFRPTYGGDYGLATFVRKSLWIRSERGVFVFLEDAYAPLVPGFEGEHARAVSIVTLGDGTTVANFHGLWRKGVGKEDLPERIRQSEIVIDALGVVTGPTVLIGDFNLNPDTESVALFEKAGFRNLIREFGITSTRTRFFDPRWSSYADYAFVRGAEVRNFRILPDEVSDHSPLLLEIGE